MQPILSLFVGRRLRRSLLRNVPAPYYPLWVVRTALNCALDLNRHGVLAKYNVEMIGADADTIDKAEDREQFDQAMTNIGLKCPRAGNCSQP